MPGDVIRLPVRLRPRDIERAHDAVWDALIEQARRQGAILGGPKPKDDGPEAA